jgi:hypothetical protein
VAGGIDDIDLFLVPKTGRVRRRDGDPALLFLFHPVHGRVTIIHASHFMDDTSIKQDALGRRRLTRVDMRDDPNISYIM